MASAIDYTNQEVDTPTYSIVLDLFREYVWFVTKIYRAKDLASKDWAKKVVKRERLTCFYSKLLNNSQNHGLPIFDLAYFENEPSKL